MTGVNERDMNLKRCLSRPQFLDEKLPVLNLSAFLGINGNNNNKKVAVLLTIYICRFATLRTILNKTFHLLADLFGFL